MYSVNHTRKLYLYGIISCIICAIWFVLELFGNVDVFMQGSTVGIYECVYNSNGDYSALNPAKVFWLIFWSIQTSWVAVFPGYIAYALFGRFNGMVLHGPEDSASLLIFAGGCMSWVQLILSTAIAVGCFITPIVTALAYGMALNNYIVLAVSGMVFS